MSKKIGVLALVLGVLFPSAVFAQETGESSTVLMNLDLLWVLTSAGMVYFMQAGFLAFEVGNVRSKNTGATAIKNMGDWVVISLVFFLVGYGVMFGESSGGLIGTSFFGGEGFSVRSDAGAGTWISFIFQLAFAGTAATIVSGAMAERTAFKAYMLFALFLGAFIYPVFGHWVWNGAGWLAKLGYHDFAGSSVVHLTGATASLVGVWMIGPRLGRYTSDGILTKMEVNSPAWSALGVIILWFGWWGFNGGSTLAFNADVFPIIVKTNIAAAAAAITAFVHCSSMQNGEDIEEKFLGGALGGLVAITAGCDVVSMPGAFTIGIAAGVLHNVTYDLILKRWRLDDVCGAIPVHGFCGILGILLIPIFTTADGKWVSRLGIQFIGVIACMLWAGAVSFLFLTIIKKTIGLRVTAMQEIRGLGISEGTDFDDDDDDDDDESLEDLLMEG